MVALSRSLEAAWNSNVNRNYGHLLRRWLLQVCQFSNLRFYVASLNVLPSLCKLVYTLTFIQLKIAISETFGSTAATSTSICDIVEEA